MYNQNFSDVFDVVVIGAGIIGSSCGYYLAKSGKKTLVLEQFKLGHQYGSSHGGSRIIRHCHSSEIYLPMARDTYKEWDKLEDIAKEKLYINNGLLWISDDLNSTINRSNILRKYSIPHELLIGSQIQRQFSHLDYNDEKWSAVWEPNAGTMLANRCMTVLQNLIKTTKHGSILAEECVTQIIRLNSSTLEIHTKSGKKFLTKYVVVTAGPWLENLIPDLPIRAVSQRIAVNYWNIEDNMLDTYQSVKSSPNLVLTKKNDEAAYYMIPCVDYPNKVKLSLHLAAEICEPELIAQNRIKSGRHNLSTPKQQRELLSNHIKTHITGIDYTKPAIEDTCFYTVLFQNLYIVFKFDENLC